MSAQLDPTLTIERRLRTGTLETRSLSIVRQEGAKLFIIK